MQRRCFDRHVVDVDGFERCEWVYVVELVDVLVDRVQLCYCGCGRELLGDCLVRIVFDDVELLLQFEVVDFHDDVVDLEVQCFALAFPF